MRVVYIQMKKSVFGQLGNGMLQVFDKGRIYQLNLLVNEVKLIDLFISVCQFGARCWPLNFCSYLPDFVHRSLSSTEANGLFLYLFTKARLI